jgi:hypothetical protein
VGVLDKAMDIEQARALLDLRKTMTLSVIPSKEGIHIFLISRVDSRLYGNDTHGKLRHFA